MAQLPLFSGFAFRSVVFVLAIGIWSAYLGWYALRVRVAVPLAGQASLTHVSKWKLSDIWVLVAMNAGMASMILGGIFLQWTTIDGQFRGERRGIDIVCFAACRVLPRIAFA